MPAPNGPSAEAAPVLARSALFSGLCLLVPVPLVDEILAERARRHMVASLLVLYGRAEDPRPLKPLWSTPWPGCLLGFFYLLRKLFLWPIKKLLRTIFFFLAARDAALEISRTYLLGRTLDRLLAAGRLTGADTVDAQQARDAFEIAFRNADRRFISAAASQLVSALKGVSFSTIRAVRDLMKRAPSDRVQPEVDALPASERGAIWQLLEQFQALLATPELRAFIFDFDRRFDEAMAAGGHPAPKG
jgi:hypothetical protein